MAEEFVKGKLVIRAAKPKEIGKIGEMYEKGKLEMMVTTSALIENEKVFVALYYGELVGFCQCGKIKGRQRGKISNIAVAKGFKKKGFGHKLIGKAHSFFASKGLSFHELRTHPKKTKFFEKAGYEQKGTKEGSKWVGMTRLKLNRRRR
ncbi:unnamed protein product [marine sediment metagenome]|uniref:N-acetyltransferase domain-containing protein n=1 Tax=marine sediment metagenome TaxID=412755 RepID=X0UED4_9ZZZZ